MDFNSAYDLLSIRRDRTRLDRGPSPGRDTSTAGPAWSVKDMAGGSSIAQRNREILNNQIKDKARDQYERDARKEVTETFQDYYSGDLGKVSLTDEQKEQRDRAVDAKMQQYDNDPKKQKSAESKLAKDIAAQRDPSRQAAGVNEQDRRAAEDAVKKIVADSKKFDNNNDAFTRNAENFGSDSFISNREKPSNSETIDEKDPPKLSPDDPADEVTLESLDGRLRILETDFRTHRANGFSEKHFYG